MRGIEPCAPALPGTPAPRVPAMTHRHLPRALAAAALGAALLLGTAACSPDAPDAPPAPGAPAGDTSRDPSAAQTSPTPSAAATTPSPATTPTPERTGTPTPTFTPPADSAASASFLTHTPANTPNTPN